MKRPKPRSRPDAPLVELPVEALDADTLREFIRDVFSLLDDDGRRQLTAILLDRAAGVTGPMPPGDAVVEEIVEFARAARLRDTVDPEVVESCLRQGSRAFQGGDYRAASRIFRALLVAIGAGDIDIGQDEGDEELELVLGEYVAQYAACAYMTALPRKRPQAVLSAIEELGSIGPLWDPLEDFELVTPGPLPEFGKFLVEWCNLLERRVRKEPAEDSDLPVDDWLRNAVCRVEGIEGLERLARALGRADDLRAWCSTLVEIGDWDRALSAYEEAARVVRDGPPAHVEFLDGAALAALKLGRRDVPKRLERAWREAPNMVRLRRWLGVARTKGELRRRAAGALPACPEEARRQRGLLHVLCGDLPAAAGILADAPGRGWSSPNHPGYLLFPLFVRLLGGNQVPLESPPDLEELLLGLEGGPLHVESPAAQALLEKGGVTAPRDAATRAAILEAMRRAAGARIAGLIGDKRHPQYDYAASMALACAEVDGSKEGAAWLASLRATCRRYPSMKRLLEPRRPRRRRG